MDSVWQENFLSLKVQINLEKHQGDSRNNTLPYSFSATCGVSTGLLSVNYSNQRGRNRLLSLYDNFPRKVCIETSTFGSFPPVHPPGAA